MNSVFTLFETDQGLEKDGIWLDFSPFGRMKIARAGGSNQKFNAAVAEALQPHRRQIQLGIADSDAIIAAVRKVYASEVVREIDFAGRDGTKIPSTPEAVDELFRELPELFEIVRTRAQNFANFRAAQQEEIAKKS